MCIHNTASPYVVVSMLICMLNWSHQSSLQLWTFPWKKHTQQKRDISFLRIRLFFFLLKLHRILIEFHHDVRVYVGTVSTRIMFILTYRWLYYSRIVSWHFCNLCIRINYTSQSLSNNATSPFFKYTFVCIRNTE